MMRVWCLSVAYIGSKSRTEKPGKTKIDTDVAHVTCDSDTTFKVKRSRSPGRFTHRDVCTSGSCSGERGKVFTVGTYCYVAVCMRSARRHLGAHRGRRGAGAYRGGRPPTAVVAFGYRRRLRRELCRRTHRRTGQISRFALVPFRGQFWFLKWKCNNRISLSQNV